MLKVDLMIMVRFFIGKFNSLLKDEKISVSYIKLDD